MHLMGYNIFDRKKIEEERRESKKGGGNTCALGKNDFKKSKSTKEDEEEGISPLNVQSRATKNIAKLDFTS